MVNYSLKATCALPSQIWFLIAKNHEWHPGTILQTSLALTLLIQPSHCSPQPQLLPPLRFHCDIFEHPASRQARTFPLSKGKVFQNMCAISGISAGEFTVKQPFDPQLGSGMKEGRERQTQLLAKWVRAAGMITWIFKMRQLQTEASVTVTSTPSCVKQWQHVVQLQFSTELLNSSAFREGRSEVLQRGMKI